MKKGAKMKIFSKNDLFQENAGLEVLVNIGGCWTKGYFAMCNNAPDGELFPVWFALGLNGWYEEPNVEQWTYLPSPPSSSNSE